MPFGTQLCIAKNILLCLQQNLSPYWEHQYPMNSTSYNLRHKENDNHTYHLHIYYIYQNHLYCLPEQARSHQGRGKTVAVAPWPLMLPVGRNKGELSAVADPDLRIRRGGWGRSAKKISLGCKNKGGPGPPAAPLDTQLIRSKANSDVADNETNAHD